MLPTEVKNALVNLEAVETKIRELKEFETKFDEMKKDLFDLMDKYNADSYTTPNGIKFTKVCGSPERTEIIVDFDMDAFKKDNSELYLKYMIAKDKKINARKGYLRMSYVEVDKEEDDK